MTINPLESSPVGPPTLFNIPTQIFKGIASVIKQGAGIQEPTRAKLVKDLQDICLNFEDVYGNVRERLIPIKSAYRNREKLATELRAFAADWRTEDKLKPEHLCSRVDHLLVELASNINPLKYAIHFGRVKSLQRVLYSLGTYDSVIYDSYREFATQLDDVATELDNPTTDLNERARYVQGVIRDLENSLRSSIKEVRAAKDQVVRMI